MPPSVDIEPGLLREVVAVSDEPSAEAAVRRALEEYVARRESHPLTQLFGSIDVDLEYDYKADRSRR